MASLFDVFFGTPQSLYASYAILAAIITICVTIILTGTEIPVANRFLFVFLTILMLLPSVFLILFQITCMVTGGTSETRWWCWLYAWIVSIFVIIYCIFVIIIAFSSLFTYSNAMNKVEMQDATNKVSPEVSNAYANKVMVEHFGDMDYLERFKEEGIVSTDTPVHVTSAPATGVPVTPAVGGSATPTIPPFSGEKKDEKKEVKNEVKEVQKNNGGLSFDHFTNGDGIEAFTNNDNYSLF